MHRDHGYRCRYDRHRCLHYTYLSGRIVRCASGARNRARTIAIGDRILSVLYVTVAAVRYASTVVVEKLIPLLACTRRGRTARLGILPIGGSAIIRYCLRRFDLSICLVLLLLRYACIVILNRCAVGSHSLFTCCKKRLSCSRCIATARYNSIARKIRLALH